MSTPTARLVIALGLGSNQPPAHELTAGMAAGHSTDARLLALESAARAAPALGWTLLAASRALETDPVGVGREHGPYLNAVVLVAASHDLAAVHLRALGLEQLAGRIGKGEGRPRPLDVDLLAAWTLPTWEPVEHAAPSLTVPHPRLVERSFALVPLAEVAGSLGLPGRAESVAQLVGRLPGDGHRGLRPGPRSSVFPSRTTGRGRGELELLPPARSGVSGAEHRGVRD